MDSRHRGPGIRVHQPVVWWKRKPARRAAAFIASVISALIIAYVLWFAGPPQSSPRAATSAIPRARVTLISGSGNAVVPEAIAQLSRPPAYPPSTAGNHCGLWWSNWFVREHAAQAEYPYLVQVAAPVKADVTVVSAQITVYQAYRPAELSYIQCLHGAGPVPGTFLNINLSHPDAPPTVISDDGSTKPLAMPGSVINVDPGHTEYIQFDTRGKKMFYEWSVRIKAVVDQHTETFSFGSAKRPLRTWLGKNPAMKYDYNLGTRRWKLSNNESF